MTTQWRNYLIALGVTIALILLLFARDAAAMATIWWTSSTFNHCMAIIPIVAWLISLRWAEVKQLTPTVWPLGFVFIGGAALLWVLGEAAGLGLLRHIALVLMIQSATITILGRQVARGLMFPLFYLIFLIPFGEELVPLLQTLTAKICVFMLTHSNIPAKIDGIFITVPNGFYQVAAACSGVKFLIAMLAYGALAANVLFRSNRRRALFMLAAIIVPIIANGIRAFGTIYIGYLTNTNFAKGFDHVVYGWFFFAFVMGLLMLGSYRFFDRKLTDPWLHDMPAARSSILTPVQGGLGAFIILLLPIAWSIAVSNAGHIAVSHPITLPDVPGWQRVDMDMTHPWGPRFDGADHRLIGRYRAPNGDVVELSITLYGWQDEGRKIIGYAHGAVDPDGPWRWTNDEPAPANGKAERILGVDQVTRLVESFYYVGGVVTANPAAIKLSTMGAKLFGGDQAVVAILVSAQEPQGADGRQLARAAVDHFVHDLGSLDKLAANDIAIARGALAMCGIAGIYHLETPKPVDPNRVRQMTDALLHRGPDGGDVWTAQGVGLGHRRLSIIDVAGSPQPMHTHDDTLTISYNGEVYNYRALRAELETLGAQFRTQGDTEVILEGYRHWGVGVLTRLNGMFAFAIYDARDGSLLLARDRLGVKPLYYTALADGSIAFASELKGLLANPAVRRVPSPQAIEDFMALGYVPDDACFVAGVKKLPAASYLQLHCGHALPAPTTWWDVDFSTQIKRKASQLEDEMRHHLREAVTSRMVADVPLGAFLSGGVDSSAVVAFMAEASRSAVDTCTIGFDTAAYDETRYADVIAQRFKTNHRKRIVASDDFGLIDTLVSAFDEPFADASALPTYRVCQLARETVTVALSGDGADEAFAGYRRYRFHYAEERVRGVLPAGMRQKVFGTLARYYPKADWAPQKFRAKATFQELALDGAEAYTRAVGVLTPELRASLYTDAFKAALQGHRAEDRYVAVINTAPAADALGAAQYADLKIWLPGDILTKVDRTSMAVSLEAREPLLDHRLIEFAATLPVGMRLRSGQGKWLMKKSLEGLLPHDTLYRPKMGFVTPISAWFRGALADMAEGVVTKSMLVETGYFKMPVLQKMVADHRAGVSDHGRLIWQLLMLEKALVRVFG